MSFFIDGFAQAWQLIITGDPYLWHLTGVTLQVAAVPTIIALLIGLPIALLLALGHFPGRRAGIALANAGLGLPPVVVGLVIALLLFPEAPLGSLGLLFTLKAVFIAQTILALPIVIALTTSAIRALPAGLIDQARAFGASWPRVAVLTLREARIGVVAAIIAAVGSALSEVGAIILVGGNIEGVDETLATAALSKISAGDFTSGLAIGIVLIVLIALVAGAFTLVQYWDIRTRPKKTT